MKKVLLRTSTAIFAFALGIASAALWISRRPSTVSNSSLSKDCPITYDAGLLAKTIRENDDPELFKAFEELPLYAMPNCVDEAYSLTWIPAFQPPVLVRVWSVGDQAFMVAKILDSQGRSKFGKVKESNTRALTKFECRNLRELINRAAYWDLPETSDEVVPEDGAVWLLDGLTSKKYHWVRRQVRKDQFAELSKHLINLSGLETAYSLYLP